MEKTKETATETESEGERRLRLEHERRIIELELLKRCSELFILICLDRIHTCKDHRLDLLKTGDSLCAWAVGMSDGITHLDLNGRLDTGNDISYTSARDLLARMHLHLEHTDLVRVVLLACADEFNLVTRLDGTVHHLEISDDTSERVEHRIEDKSLKRSIRISLRCRHPFNDGIKHLLDSLSGLS